MTRVPAVAGLLLAFLTPSALFALATEQLGNAPIPPGNFDGNLLKAVNVESRVYWYEVNGNPTFFFKGGPKDLNEAVRHFAALTVEKKEIILLPGAGRARTFAGKPVPFDWSLHVPMGFAFGGDSDVADTRATLTIHVTDLMPAAPTYPLKVKAWIADLNSDDFKTRDKAALAIEAIGPPAAALLRETLKAGPSAEARDRLERLLAKAGAAIRLDVLDLPAGLPVVGLENLLKRARKELANPDHMVRGYAVSSLSRHGTTTAEILPDIEKVLKDEKHEYPLRCATGAAGRLGAAAKALLPVLRDRLDTKDENVINACKYAIDAIEKAKPEPESEAEVKARTALRVEIEAFVAARAATPKK